MHASTLLDGESLELTRGGTRTEGRERARLVFANVCAEADHIGREDGGEAAGGHSGTPALRMPS